MRNVLVVGACFYLLGSAGTASGATLCVWPNSPHPGAPYNAWTNAAHQIQTAVDAAAIDDLVWVTNGVYSLTNGISVDQRVTIRSVNGWTNTIVDGGYPARSNRCFKLGASNSVLDGFTIRNGYGESFGGGVTLSNGAVLRNCWVVSNQLIGVHARWNVVVENCVIGHSTNDNLNFYKYCRASNCLIQFGQSGSGVAMQSSTLENSQVVSNKGTGVLIILDSTITRCLIAGNGDSGVAAVNGGSIRNCLIVGNTSPSYGGGIRAWNDPGAVVEACTIAGNTATTAGGGVFTETGYDFAMQNCIVYDNSAPSHANCNNNNSHATLNYLCTTPSLGDHCVVDPPQFVDSSAGDYRLHFGSPCIDVGVNQNWMTNATDYTGNQRIIHSTVDIGACEYAQTALACDFSGTPLFGTSPLAVTFSSEVGGTNTTVTWYGWDFNNDGSFDRAGAGLAIVTNTYTNANVFSIRLSVSNSVGEQASAVHSNYVRTSIQDVYVALSGTHVFPYTNWATAATNIAAGVAAAVAGGTVVVTDGVYEVSSAVTVTNAVTVRSVNGWSSTTVNGGYPSRTTRCFYLNHSNAVVEGFLIMRGRDGGNGGGVYMNGRGVLRDCAVFACSAGSDGGGVYCNQGGLVDRCVIASNSATWVGGVCLASGGTLQSSLVFSNHASSRAGGSRVDAPGKMVNSTVVRNSAGDTAGGIEGNGPVVNSILYFNTAPSSSNYSAGPVFTNSCAAPLPSGPGNISGNPMFVAADGGDFRLSTNSPCVEAGTNQAWMAAGMDLEGKPRLLGTNVDIGAYEVIPLWLDSNTNGMPDWWEWEYSHNTTGMVAGADTDNDYVINLYEYLAGTLPNDSASFLGMNGFGVQGSGVTGLVVRWQSVAGKLYNVDRATNLTENPAFGNIYTGVVGRMDITTITDATATAKTPYFYRVGIGP